MRYLTCIIKQADKLWFQACVDKFGELCEYCGKPMMQVHHFYRKSNYGHIRYSLVNGVVCCQGCHIRADEPPFIDKIREKRGEEWYSELKDLALHPPSDYKNTIKWHKEQLTKLKNTS